MNVRKVDIIDGIMTDIVGKITTNELDFDINEEISRNIDGGFANSIYLTSQVIDGGDANS
jgi:hypothetical protein